MNLLHIDSSVLGAGSASRELTAAAVARLRASHPGIEVTRLDLDAEPLPHLGSGSLAGTDPAEAARAKRALEDFLAADLLVIGAPMYNFSIPSTLKAWIDRIAVAGTTFRYTANGPEGLAGGKRVVLVITQGGVHPAGGASDFQEAYLRHMLGFLGITDIAVVRADGLALSPERRREALDQALGALPALAEAA